MKLVSINVGAPREVESQGAIVRTSIFKTPVSGPEGSLSVADLVALYTAETANRDLLRRASELQPLPDGWRDHFRKQLAKPDSRRADG